MLSEITDKYLMFFTLNQNSLKIDISVKNVFLFLMLEITTNDKYCN